MNFVFQAHRNFGAVPRSATGKLRRPYARRLRLLFFTRAVELRTTS
jgi:hypothetical protein